MSGGRDEGDLDMAQNLLSEKSYSVNQHEESDGVGRSGSGMEVLCQSHHGRRNAAEENT